MKERIYLMYRAGQVLSVLGITAGYVMGSPALALIMTGVSLYLLIKTDG